MRRIDADHLKETLDYYIREAGWGEEINMALGWVKDEFIDSEPTVESSFETEAETKRYSKDAISRQVALAEMDKLFADIKRCWKGRVKKSHEAVYLDMKATVEHLPSVEPEIIHCRDCANLQSDDLFHDFWCDGKKVWLDHYCGYARRKADAED